jgi:hypothetical protein
MLPPSSNWFAIASSKLKNLATVFNLPTISALDPLSSGSIPDVRSGRRSGGEMAMTISTELQLRILWPDRSGIASLAPCRIVGEVST